MKELTAAYRRVETSEIVELALAGAQKAGLNLADVSLTTKTLGRKFSRHVTELRLNSLTVNGLTPMVFIDNSYRGESAITVRCGMFRFVCSNGLVLGEQLYGARLIHRQGPKLEGWLDVLADTVCEAISASVKLMTQLSEGMVGHAVGVDYGLAMIDALEYLTAGQRLEASHLWRFEASRRFADRGYNLWSLWNIVNESIRRGARTTERSAWLKNNTLLADLSEATGYVVQQAA